MTARAIPAANGQTALRKESSARIAMNFNKCIVNFLSSPSIIVVNDKDSTHYHAN